MRPNTERRIDGTLKGIYGRDFHPQIPGREQFLHLLRCVCGACVSRLQAERLPEAHQAPAVGGGAGDPLLAPELAERVGDRGRAARVAARLGDLRVAEAPQTGEHEALVPAAGLSSDGGEHVGGESDGGGGSSHGFPWSAGGSLCEREQAR